MRAGEGRGSNPSGGTARRGRRHGLVYEFLFALFDLFVLSLPLSTRRIVRHLH